MIGKQIIQVYIFYFMLHTTISKYYTRKTVKEVLNNGYLLVKLGLGIPLDLL